jgi:hypothetical protein
MEALAPAEPPRRRACRVTRERRDRDVFLGPDVEAVLVARRILAPGRGGPLGPRARQSAAVDAQQRQAVDLKVEGQSKESDVVRKPAGGVGSGAVHVEDGAAAGRRIVVA